MFLYIILLIFIAFLLFLILLQQDTIEKQCKKIKEQTALIHRHQSRMFAMWNEREDLQKLFLKTKKALEINSMWSVNGKTHTYEELMNFSPYIQHIAKRVEHPLEKTQC